MFCQVQHPALAAECKLSRSLGTQTCVARIGSAKQPSTPRRKTGRGNRSARPRLLAGGPRRTWEGTRLISSNDKGGRRQLVSRGGRETGGRRASDGAGSFWSSSKSGSISPSCSSASSFSGYRRPGSFLSFISSIDQGGGKRLGGVVAVILTCRRLLADVAQSACSTDRPVISRCSALVLLARLPAAPSPPPR